MQVSLQRILVATDFSPAANHALEFAHTLADTFGAELHVLHVVVEPLPLPGPEGTWILPEHVTPGLVQKAEQELAVITKDLTLSSGKRPTCAAIVGYPIEQVMAYFKHHQIDLIVLGTQGHRGLSHLLLGSVAEKIVRLATCPVLTVHPPAERA